MKLCAETELLNMNWSKNMICMILKVNVLVGQGFEKKHKKQKKQKTLHCMHLKKHEYVVD